MWILIDDKRDFNCDIICRTGVIGLLILEAMVGKIETLCIDHDLGDADNINGLDVIRTAIKMKLLPSHVQIVSANPVGVQNITVELLKAGFNIDATGRNFYRH